MKPTPAHQLERSEREEFRKALHNWYRNNMRQLPWRQTRDPYRIWASEVMLQQTQTKAVLSIAFEKPYPVRQEKKPVTEYPMAIGVVVKGRRLLIVQRPLNQMLGGLWEFPGGRIGSEGTADAACLRAVEEMVGLRVAVDSHLTRIRHAYTNFKIVADIFGCRYTRGRVRRNGPSGHRWVGMKTLRKYPFIGSHHKFMHDLMEWYAALFRDFV